MKLYCTKVHLRYITACLPSTNAKRAKVSPYTKLPIIPYTQLPIIPYTQLPIISYTQLPIIPYTQLPIIPYTHNPIYLSTEILSAVDALAVTEVTTCRC